MDYVEKIKNSQKQNVVEIGYVMMLMNIFHFHTRETVVIETMTVTPFVLIITMKDTQETGKNALNVKRILKQRCMSTLVQMSGLPPLSWTGLPPLLWTYRKV